MDSVIDDRESFLHYSFHKVKSNSVIKTRVIPQSSSLQPSILADVHNIPKYSHIGHRKTYKQVAMQLYWMGMKRDMNKSVNECQICQHNKSSDLTPARPFQPLPITQSIWETFPMWLIVDRLSIYSLFISIEHPFDA